ncbi:MAG TPA: type II toxin-antitoxin system RelE/ParE family toxin [Edaphobacter sp.]|jgi:toxin ParE1/3/4|nr:type II toxin-antitoxin system RelE/ParE family toxin [Edaphobacter sp.]
MKVIWTVQALRDLLMVREHIEKDNKNAAVQVANRLRAAAKRLASHPETGRPGRVGSTRELVVPGTPYILPYQVRRGEVEILAVIHGAQEWPETFS